MIFIPTNRSDLTELDARTCEPPEVVDIILTALNAIPWDVPQYVRTKERPVKLLLVSEDLGFCSDSEPLLDGSWRTALRRPAPSAEDPSRKDQS